MLTRPAWNGNSLVNGVVFGPRQFAHGSSELAKTI